jgi:hypothetical protein
MKSSLALLLAEPAFRAALLRTCASPRKREGKAFSKHEAANKGSSPHSTAMMQDSQRQA